MIGIEPFYLVGSHQREVYSPSVEGEERQRLEPIEHSEGRTSFAWHHGDEVLVPDTVSACHINGGFVARYHTCKQRLGVVLHTNTLRSFVYAEIMPYAVPRTVSEVFEVCPEILPCQHVELCPACALREYGLRQGYHTFEHKRKIPLLLSCEPTQSNGTCDIGSAVCVLPSRVEKEKPCGTQSDVALRCGRIVYNSSVCLVGCYRLEALGSDTCEA